MTIPREIAAKVLDAEVRNAVTSVSEGGTLPGALREQVQAMAMTPDLAKQARAASLVQKWCSGGDLTASQWDEVREVYPDFSSARPPEETPPAAARVARLTKEDVARYELLYKKKWRQIRRWQERGDESKDPCPLNEPAKMPAWWIRNMRWRVPPEIESAALEAAQGQPSPPPSPAETPPAASAPSNAEPVKPQTGTPIDLESFDPEEGDRLRELKQIQAAKFDELKKRLARGEDSTVLESKYLKLCETVDKIETRVSERLKKRGLFILRAEVERDQAAACELLRQTKVSLIRRVLELCPSLSAEQKAEVSAALSKSQAQEEKILSHLDCLTTDDLLRELAA